MIYFYQYSRTTNNTWSHSRAEFTWQNVHIFTYRYIYFYKFFIYVTQWSSNTFLDISGLYYISMLYYIIDDIFSRRFFNTFNLKLTMQSLLNRIIIYLHYQRDIYYNRVIIQSNTFFDILDSTHLREYLFSTIWNRNSRTW